MATSETLSLMGLGVALWPHVATDRGSEVPLQDGPRRTSITSGSTLIARELNRKGIQLPGSDVRPAVPPPGPLAALLIGGIIMAIYIAQR